MISVSGFTIFIQKKFFYNRIFINRIYPLILFSKLFDLKLDTDNKLKIGVYKIQKPYNKFKS